MRTTKETRKSVWNEGPVKEWCLCPCGNSPATGQIQPCNSFGEPLDPRFEEWPVPLLTCLRCGRVILYYPSAVVGMRHNNRSSLDGKEEMDNSFKEGDQVRAY